MIVNGENTVQEVGTIVCKAGDGSSKAGGEDGAQKEEEEPLFMRYVKNMPLDFNDPTYLEKAYGTNDKPEPKPANTPK